MFFGLPLEEAQGKDAPLGGLAIEGGEQFAPGVFGQFAIDQEVELQVRRSIIARSFWRARKRRIWTTPAVTPRRWAIS